jgi:rubredoxin
MSHWKCSGCGYTFQSDSPPQDCPSCQQKCTFSDVSCYVPECGGPESGNVDPRLLDPKKPHS